MSTRELVHWMAFFKREQREQARAQQNARDTATAEAAARKLAGNWR